MVHSCYDAYSPCGLMSHECDRLKQRKKGNEDEGNEEIKNPLQRHDLIALWPLSQFAMSCLVSRLERDLGVFALVHFHYVTKIGNDPIGEHSSNLLNLLGF